MRLIFDFLLVVSTTGMMIRSLRLIAQYRTSSLSDWAITLLFVFQSLPVLLDLVFGIPKYSVWFSEFENAMSNDIVCIIYDIYIIAINIFLMNVSILSQRDERQQQSNNLLDLTKGIPDLVLFILILSPLFHVLLSGNLDAFLVYNSFGGRGLQSSFTELNSVLVIVSTLSLMIWYFRRDSNIIRIFMLIVFSLMITWISGKRYSVVTILFSYLYMNVIERRESRNRVNIRLLITVGSIVIVLYSVYYITNIRMSTNVSFDSIYEALRIDFGRDDVVKFTIMKEYIQGEHILDYPLQTVISTLVMIVPRSLFPAKGYPHYRYLTAAIYNTDVLMIPSGMTPSILEMMISNFRFFGMPLCIVMLCWYCGIADRAQTSLQQYCYGMVLMGMLTQSLDSMFILFYMVLYFIITRRIRVTN